MVVCSVDRVEAAVNDDEEYAYEDPDVEEEAVGGDEEDDDEDEYADELDVDNEGFLSQPSIGRSSNYTTVEDKLICKAWKKVALDAAVGTEQAGNTY